MLKTITLALAAFIGTNIDDLFINMFFFLNANSPAENTRITVGKYCGMGALTAFSLLSAFGLQLLDAQWLSLLGIVPIVLGVREIISHLRRQNSQNAPKHPAAALWLSVMLVTLANGADNIGIYIPLFASFTLWQMAVTVCIFALMTGLSCLIAKRLSSLPFLHNFLNRYRQLIIPAVYLLLGLYILFKA